VVVSVNQGGPPDPAEELHWGKARETASGSKLGRCDWEFNTRQRRLCRFLVRPRIAGPPACPLSPGHCRPDRRGDGGCSPNHEGQCAVEPWAGFVGRERGWSAPFALVRGP
jgi:hypothetical protein